MKLVAAYPVGSDKHKFPRSLEELKKERIVSRIKYVKQKYRSAVDSGKVSDNERIVSLFFDLCSDIWGGSPATENLVIGEDSSASGPEIEQEKEVSGEDDDVSMLIKNQKGEKPHEVLKSDVDNVRSATASSSTGIESDPIARRGLISNISEYRKSKLVRKTLKDAQMINLAKHDYELKKKIVEEMSESDKEFKNNIKTMTDCMQSVSRSLENGFTSLNALIGTLNHQAAAAQWYAAPEEDDMFETFDRMTFQSLLRK